MVRLMEGEQECNNRTQTSKRQGGPDKSRAVVAAATPCAAWGWRAIAARAEMARLERTESDQQAMRQRCAGTAHGRV